MRMWLVLVLLLAACSPFVATNPQTLADPEGQFLSINGVQTYVIDVGPRDGQPVVLLHGFGASTVSWRHTIPALTAAGYRAIAFDRPGFGLSDKSYDLDYSHTNQAAHTIALMDTLQIERAVLVGHSQGGNVITHAALAYPERVESLVIVAGAVILDDHTSTLGQIAVTSSGFLVNLASYEPLAALIGAGLQLYLTPDRIQDILRSAYASPDAVTAATVEDYLRPFYTPNWDLGLIAMVRDGAGNEVPPAQLEQIRQPVMLIWGEADAWVPVSNGEQLRQYLTTDIIWHTYPEVGHMVMEEAPDTFNRDLLEFLAGIAYQLQVGAPASIVTHK